MSAHSVAPSGATFHHLMVEAEPEANALLRVLEPFVIHDVLPHRVDVAAPDGARDGALRLDLHFCASADLAARLEARLATMVTVRHIRLMRTGMAVEAAA
ncbi:hypothetical protein ABLE91_22680 [Aquabacter sp. CN5-332]|uniref:hypothetical protein n=1 Tax=Aquabacter sp. CN5-332 TaxID=3156608 RepID=UPI0032B5F04A